MLESENVFSIDHEHVTEYWLKISCYNNCSSRLVRENRVYILALIEDCLTE